MMTVQWTAQLVPGRWMMAGLVIWLLAACTGSGSIEAGEQPTDAPVGRPQGESVSISGTEVEWFLERITPDGMTVWVITPTGPCGGRGAPDSLETAEAVHLVTRLVQPRGGGVCDAGEHHLQHRFRLDRPLGDRLLTGCLRPDCRAAIGVSGQPRTTSLALDALRGQVVVAGTVQRPDGDRGHVVVASGVARLHATTGEAVWGTSDRRRVVEHADPLGAPRAVDDLVAVDLDASGDLAVFTALGAGPVAVVRGLSGDGRHAAGGLWLGTAELLGNLSVLDLTRVRDAGGGGAPIDVDPPVRWEVADEVVVADVVLADGIHVVVTQDPRAGADVLATVRVRTLVDGELLGGGVVRALTRLGDAGLDARGRLVGVGKAGPTLTAVDALTGRARWQIDAERVGVDPDEVAWVRLASQSLVLVLAGDRLHALDVVDGSQRWDVPVGGVGADAQHAVAGEVVILTGADGVVRALDLTDGTVLWSTPVVTDQRFPVPTPATPTVIGEMVAVAIDDAAVGLDVASGELRWSTALADALDG